MSCLGEEAREAVDYLYDLLDPEIAFAMEGITVVEYRYVMHRHSVYFMGQHIWDSDNDERPYNEELDEYEPLRTYLSREIGELLDRLNKGRGN